MLGNPSTDVAAVIHRETYEGWKIKTRTIKNHELVFITEGEMSVSIAGKKYICKENELIYFYPGLIHSLKALKPPYAVFYAFHFDTEFKLPIPDISKIQNHYNLRELLKSLYNTSVKKEYMYSWKLNILAQNILFETMKQSNERAAPANLNRINNVLKYIHENPDKKTSIEELTKIADMKKSYFIQIFKSITGKSPIKYIIDLRLEYAKDLIFNTELPINKIALQCGFEDEFYFSRIFKKRYGVSPKNILKIG